MPSPKSSGILLFLSLTSFLFTFTTAANPTFLSHSCPNTTTFSQNSTYQTNLNRLLSSLPSNANNSDGFFNSTSGQVPNRVYGLFLCRGDVTTSACHDCVSFAARDITQRCPVEKQAVVWYDECFLRYSNDNIFSTSDENPGILMWNLNNITEPERFNQVLGSVINLAATQAASSPKMFAVGKGNFTAFQTLYCLVQCTPDLSSSDCNRCLRIAIANMPKDKVGGKILYPSCYTRYEMYPFYNESMVATPVPPPVFEPPPPPGSVTRPKSKVESTIDHLL